MRTAAALLALTLGACAAPGTIPAEQRLVDACHVYAGALDALAAQREAGSLSRAQIAAVDRTRAIVNPICAGDPFGAEDVDLEIKLAEAELAIDRLISIQREAAP